MNDQGAKVNSGDKNSYQFLIKHLIIHFPDQKWEDTFRILKSEPQTGKNINWKQIFLRVCKDGLNKGPDSKEWLTVLKLMEIAKSPESFLSFNGKSVIRWIADRGTKDAYLKKCKNQISFHMRLIVRECIQSSGLHKDIKQLFEDTLPKDNHSFIENSSINAREDDRYNGYMREDDSFHYNVSKKLKTDTMSQTYKSVPRIDEEQEEIFMDEETNFIANARVSNQNQMKTYQEEEKHNYNNFGYNNQLENHEFFEKEFATADEKDKQIDELKRQLAEKDRNLDKKDKCIEDLNRQLAEKEKIIAEQNQRIVVLNEEKSNIILGMNNLNIDNDEDSNQILKFASSGNN